MYAIGMYTTVVSLDTLTDIVYKRDKIQKPTNTNEDNNLQGRL